MSWVTFAPTKQKTILIANRHRVLTVSKLFTYHSPFYPPNKLHVLNRPCAEIKRKQSCVVNNLSLQASRMFEIAFLPDGTWHSWWKRWRGSRTLLPVSLERRWEGRALPLSRTLGNGRSIKIIQTFLCYAYLPPSPATCTFHVLRTRVAWSLPVFCKCPELESLLEGRIYSTWLHIIQSLVNRNVVIYCFSTLSHHPPTGLQELRRRCGKTRKVFVLGLFPDSWGGGTGRQSRSSGGEIRALLAATPTA